MTPSLCTPERGCGGLPAGAVGCSEHPPAVDEDTPTAQVDTLKQSHLPGLGVGLAFGTIEDLLGPCVAEPWGGVGDMGN